MKYVWTLLLATLLVACADGNIGVHNSDGNDSSLISSNKEEVKEENGQSAPGMSAPRGLGVQGMPKGLLWGPFAQSYTVRQQVCGQGKTCDIAIFAHTASGDVQLWSNQVQGLYRVNQSVQLPAWTHYTFVRVTDVSSGSFGTASTDPELDGSNFGSANFKTESRSTQTSTSTCARGDSCGGGGTTQQQSTAPPLNQVDLCIAIGLWGEAPDPTYSLEIGKNGPGILLNSLSQLPSMDAKERGFFMPLWGFNSVCEFDIMMPHASSSYGATGLKNLGMGANNLDVFDNLAELRPNPALGGTPEAPFGLQTSVLSLGNNINEGGLTDPFPTNLQVSDLSQHALREIGMPMVLLAAENAFKSIGGFVLNGNANGDEIMDFSFAPDLQALPASVLSESTQVEVVTLDKQDGDGYDIQLVLASGDHNNTLDYGVSGTTSIYDCAFTELGLDVLEVSRQTTFPYAQYTRKTAELFKKSDGSDFPVAYNCSGATPSVANSARLYMSDVTVINDNEGYPLFVIGSSRAGDIYFNLSFIPDPTNPDIEGGAVFEYKEDEGLLGEFWQQDQAQLDALGLGSFLTDVANAVDIRYEENAIASALKALGGGVPDVADGILVIARNDQGPIVYEYRAGAAQPFIKITGAGGPQAYAAHAAAFNMHLDPLGYPLNQSENWSIEQTVAGSTPEDLQSMSPEDNSLVMTTMSATFGANITSQQNIDLQLNTFMTLENGVIRAWNNDNTINSYLPIIFAACNNNNAQCDSLTWTEPRIFAHP